MQYYQEWWEKKKRSRWCHQADGSTCWLFWGHIFSYNSSLITVHWAAQCSTGTEMSSITDLAALLLLLLSTIGIGKVEAKECCKDKRVGSVSYTLLPDDHQSYSRELPIFYFYLYTLLPNHQNFLSHRELPSQCINNCIYSVVGSSSPKFCFQKGFFQILHSSNILGLYLSLFVLLSYSI